jgi:hypothetical protein
MKKLLLAGATIAGLVALTASSAALAAQTRSLPDGSTLFAIDCEDENGELGSVDITTAEVTIIGTGSDHVNIDCASDATYDPTTGLGYWIPWSAPNSLYSIDLETGVSTYIGDLTDSEGINDLYAGYNYALMADDQGNLFAIMPYTDDNGEPYLLSVDKETAEFTEIDRLQFDGSDWGDGYFYSGDFNPADGNFYILGNDAVELYSLDIETAQLTFVGDNGDAVYMYGIGFDSNGVMWSTGENAVCSATVEGWTTVGNTECSENDTYINGDTSITWYSESNFINYDAPAPELSDTGVNLGGFAAAIAALVAAGGILMAVRHRKA